MKNLIKTGLLLIILSSLLFSCGEGSRPKSGADTDKESAAMPVPVPVVGKETELLLKELADNGDYVNSQQYPSLIKASLVNEADGGRNLVIDIRPAGKYAGGHIKGAVNKRFEDLPAYFESGIKPFEYEKIILVCDDGQISSYTASLLRLKGYGNVFAMRWGMSGWNMSYAESGWLSGLSGKFESMLDTVTHLKPPAGEMPLIATGKSTGPEVADSRFETLFSEGTDRILISAGEVFSDPDSYYIINLERKDKYEDGHMPGSVRYKPDGTLGIVGEMCTIPAGKTVVVYCGTGHNSAFATAYLRLFGYNARTLKYGNNSFMYDRMIRQKASLSWIPFTKSDVNDFGVVR